MERCDVVVTGFRLNAAEKPAVALQRVLGLGADEARAMTKRFPCVVRGELPTDEAQALQSALREAGAHVQLREPGRSMPPETGMPFSVLPSGMAPPAGPRTGPASAPAAQRSEPAPEVARSESAPVVARSEPAPAASTSVPAAAPHAAPPEAARTSALGAIPPPAPTGLDLSQVPLLFRSTLTALSAPLPPRTSAPYQLGELVVVATKSQPAPALSTSEPAPGKSQPAPAPSKSQPAPAPSKSQPAPGPSKSQPAPILMVETGGMQMFKDPFRATGDFGPALDIDHTALADRSARVETTFHAGQALDTPAPPTRRGLLATLLLPVVLLTTATPHALALTGVAAASGAAVYLVRKTAREEARSARAAQAHGQHGAQAKRGGLIHALDELSGGRLSGESDRADDPASAAGPSEQDKLVDHQGEREARAEGTAGATRGTGTTHPLLRTTPEAMQASVASILRSRIAGVHKVAIEWPEGTHPGGQVECTLLDASHADNLDELTSTGDVVDLPDDVREQFQGHVEVLRAANANPNATFTPICLAN